MHCTFTKVTFAGYFISPPKPLIYPLLTSAFNKNVFDVLPMITLTAL